MQLMSADPAFTDRSGSTGGSGSPDSHSTADTAFTLAGHSVMLAARRWEPESPRYIALLCHGYGEHSGRYGYVATRLTSDGAVVYAIDHIGTDSATDSGSSSRTSRTSSTTSGSSTSLRDANIPDFPWCSSGIRWAA